LKSPPVTIIIATWNSVRHLDGCLGSIMRQVYRNFRVLAVDGASSDGTAEYIRQRFPEVNVLKCQENLGYRRANALGMARATGSYVVVTNDDVEVDENWLGSLVQYMEANSRTGLATPLILYHSDPGLVNGAGNILHFTGMYCSRGKNRPREEYALSGPVPAVSGCCFIVRREVLERVGGFSGDFDAYDTGWHSGFEDVDLCWRARMSGYEIGYVAESVLYHKYTQRPMVLARYVSYEFGRYLVAIRNFERRTLLLLLPLLVVIEAGSLLYSLYRGPRWLMAKGRLWIWMLRHVVVLRGMRTRVQSARTLGDKRVLAAMSPELCISVIGQWQERAANAAFRAYRALLGRLVAA
jgi:GT2 family glycosyltransferase